MKANEAPENMYIPQKIYLPYKDGKVIGILKETGVPFKSGVDGNIEYTRTDAFIKKAKKWFKNQPETYDANGIRCYGTEDFEDFRKYMEGE